MDICKVVIGIPSYKGPDVHCFDQHFEFMHYLGRLQERSWYFGNVPFICDQKLPPLDPFGNGAAELRPGDPQFQFFTATVTGNSLIGQARDLICERALDFGADYVLMWDDDMIFARDAFLRLWRHRKPFIGALAFTAREPIAPVLYKFDRQFDFANRTEKVDHKVWLDYPKDQLVQVDAIGTGMVLIDCDVLRKLKAPWFDGSSGGAGEDIAFGFRCTMAGIGVWCDTSVKTIHKPNFPLQWHDEAYYEKTKERAEAFYKERKAG